jgi:Uma2 family endonuclease
MMQLPLFPQYLSPYPQTLDKSNLVADKEEIYAKKQQLKADDDDILYPESDGKPMAENTEHFELITMLKQALDALFQHDDNVFVGGDLLWYPVKGDKSICLAPDSIVVIGRPKKLKRGSYIQHKEDGIAPQFTFEFLSPSNNFEDQMKRKAFYSAYGVMEYFTYHLKTKEIVMMIRIDGQLTPALPIFNNSSATILKGARFEVIEGEFRVIYPDGTLALKYTELDNQLKKETQAKMQVVRELEKERKAKKQALKEVEKERMEKEKERKEKEEEILAKEQALQELNRLKVRLSKYENE